MRHAARKMPFCRRRLPALSSDAWRWLASASRVRTGGMPPSRCHLLTPTASEVIGRLAMFCRRIKRVEWHFACGILRAKCRPARADCGEVIGRLAMCCQRITRVGRHFACGMLRSKCHPAHADCRPSHRTRVDVMPAHHAYPTSILHAAMPRSNCHLAHADCRRSHRTLGDVLPAHHACASAFCMRHAVLKMPSSSRRLQ